MSLVSPKAARIDSELGPLGPEQWQLGYLEPKKERILMFDFDNPTPNHHVAKSMRQLYNTIVWSI